MTEEVEAEARVYGWKRDSVDPRDYKYKIPSYHTAQEFPKQVDLRPHMPPVYNQGAIGSCTGNALACAIEYNRKREGLTDFLPSRLFIYYNERLMEGIVNEDGGGQLRDGIKSVASDGACSEDIWPYDIGYLTQKPSDAAYSEAKKDLVTRYMRVDQDLASIKSVLFSQQPVVFGFMVFDGFQSEQAAKTGIINIPTIEERALGGHAVIMVGYDDDKQCFIVRNSWGPEWGDKGYFYLPYRYVLNSDWAADFWVVQSVNNG